MNMILIGYAVLDILVGGLKCGQQVAMNYSVHQNYSSYFMQLKKTLPEIM